MAALGSRDKWRWQYVHNKSVCVLRPVCEKKKVLTDKQTALSQMDLDIIHYD